MTMWFDRKPGDVVSIGVDDPTTLLLSDGGPPDWVRTPPEVGGQKLKVVRAFIQKCPLCDIEQLVRHLECEQGYFVAECVHHGFAWYKRK